jgi:DNA polymerase
VAEALARVRAGVLACPVYAALRERGALRDTMVFAVGNPCSPLVFVGEAPGAEEEKLGEPFVGPAGQLLTKMITAMGLERSKVYITNIVKYRPAIGDGDQGSRNRRPTAEEIAAGLPHLRKELAELRPKVLVALGATALEGLAGEPLAIGQARGQWRTFEGIPMMPTFHPSYLLRNESLTERRKVWEDLLQVMERLGLPISAKQRAFFKA